MIKKLPKKSIQKLTWLYFLMAAAIIVAIILCVELIFVRVYTDNQRRRALNAFKESKALAQTIKDEYDPYSIELELKLENYKKTARKIVEKYSSEIEFFIFSYDEKQIGEEDQEGNEDQGGMDLRDALSASVPFTTIAYFTSNAGAAYNAKTDVFVSNHESQTAEDIFGMFDYNYNLNRDNNDVFDYGNINLGDRNAIARIYGGALAHITSIGVDSRVVLYFRATVVQKEIGINAMIIAAVLASVFALGLSFILSIWLSNKISKPIQNYADAAQKLGQGNYRQKIEIDDKVFYELKQLGQAFNQAAEEIEKTDTQRKEFLANITHDLRTPLTMIRAYAEMIRDISGSNENKRNAHAQIIIDEADRLSLLVEDVLNVSKLEAGTLKMNFVLTDMTNLCRNALALYNVKIEKDGYHIISSLDENAFAIADAQRITQVIHNLIQNAVNYTGEDKTVKVNLKKLDDGVRIEISDSGVGIAPEDIESVWTRYYQVNQKKRGKMGSGLGLDIAHGILTSHNAKFGIESELGKGTTFWFELSSTTPPVSED